MRYQKPRFRKRKSIMASVKRVLRNPRIGGFLGIETKFYDKTLANAALTNPSDASGGEHDISATVLFNTVVQGDGESQRDGRVITMKNLTVKGQVNIVPQAGTTVVDGATIVFIALVLDRQTNGATISSEDVFTNPGAATLAPFPFRNLQNIKRFRVLATRSFTMDNPTIANDLGSTGGIIQAGLAQKFTMFVNLRGMKTTYTGTTETVANISDNSLHLIAYCSSTQLAPTITYNSRLRYMG